TRKGRAKLVRDLVVVQAFDRGDTRSVAGAGVGDTGADRHIIEQEGARAAYAMLAAEMSAGQVEGIAQEIRKMGPRLDRCADCASVDRDQDLDRVHAADSLIARRSSVVPMCRSVAFVTPALIRRASATRASNRCLNSPVTRPPNSGAASRRTIGAVSMAPITTRDVSSSRSIRTAAIACANSPGLRQAFM